MKKQILALMLVGILAGTPAGALICEPSTALVRQSSFAQFLCNTAKNGITTIASDSKVAAIDSTKIVHSHGRAVCNLAVDLVSFAYQHPIALALTGAAGWYTWNYFKKKPTKSKNAGSKANKMVRIYELP